MLQVGAGFLLVARLIRETLEAGRLPRRCVAVDLPRDGLDAGSDSIGIVRPFNSSSLEARIVSDDP